MVEVGPFSVLGILKNVVLTNSSEPDFDMSGQAGSHDPSTGRIEINTDMVSEATVVRETIVHEAVHAFICDSGARHMLQSALGYSESKYEDFEEGLVRALTPALLSALPSLWALIGTLTKVKRALKKAKE